MTKKTCLINNRYKQLFVQKVVHTYKNLKICVWISKMFYHNQHLCKYETFWVHYNNSNNNNQAIGALMMATFNGHFVFARHCSKLYKCILSPRQLW